MSHLLTEGEKVYVGQYTYIGLNVRVCPNYLGV